MDEEGIKIYKKASEQGLTPLEYLDKVYPNYINFFTDFGIEYDNFYRTSSEKHSNLVQTVWTKLFENGYIYKKKYKGKYCVGCESFKLDKDLLDGICLDHPNFVIDTVEEENYFFKLSSQKSDLKEWINTHEDFLVPSTKLPELKNLIDGIEDISISRDRKSCPWGTLVPNDKSQTIYIWFSALLNYIFSAGYLTDEFNWDNVIQTCGPDNLRFQAVIFPAILAALDIKKSNKLLVHGTVLNESGKKISKSFGDTIDPTDKLEKYGVNAVRYYCLCGLSTYSNSSWIDSDLIRIWNVDICNDWGNLISRVLHLIDIKLDGNTTGASDHFADAVSNHTDIIHDLWNNFKIKDALQRTNELVKFANRYVNEQKPWSSEAPTECLNNLYYLLNIINELYRPVFPDKYYEVKKSIEDKTKSILFNRI